MELAASSEPKPGLLSRALSRVWRWLRPPRRVRPTKAGWAFLGILWAIFFAALNSGNNLLYLILALLFALISVSGLFSEYSIRPVRLTLEFPRAVTAGEPFHFLTVLENTSKRRAAYLLSCDPAQLQPKGRLELTGPQWTAYLAPSGDRAGRGESRVNLWQELTAPKRGVLDLEEVYLATRGPFGLFDRRKRIACGAQVFVLPRAHKYDNEEIAGPVGAGTQLRKVAGQGYDLRHIRDYQQGEEARRIAWRPSARAGKLLVRENEDETVRRARVALASAVGETMVERQASVARYVCEDLLARGYQVRLEVPGAPLPENYAGSDDQLLEQLLPLARWHGTGAAPAVSAEDSRVPVLSVLAGGRVESAPA